MRLGFIGFGNMARALAEGLLRKGALTAEEMGACARDFAKLQRNTQQSGIRAFERAADLVAFADTVVVAVKPHQVEEALAPLRDALHGKCVVSVAAGWCFDDYERLLAPGTHHLSTIPNTPVSVGEGIIVCERRHSLSDAEWQAVRELFGRIGLVPTVDTAQLSAAGTICGCGPAFIALSIEALADAAVKHGIARDEAYRMVSQMVVGTGRLQLESGEHPGRLKDQVCSPGGTTIEGVASLQADAFDAAISRAVDAALEKDSRI